MQNLEHLFNQLLDISHISLTNNWDIFFFFLLLLLLLSKIVVTFSVQRICKYYGTAVVLLLLFVCVCELMLNRTKGNDESKHMQILWDSICINFVWVCGTVKENDSNLRKIGSKYFNRIETVQKITKSPTRVGGMGCDVIVAPLTCQ